MKINSNYNLKFRANIISKIQAEHIKTRLENAKSVDIFCHDDTDVDGAASAVVMSDYLSKKGIKSKIILSQNLSLLKLRDYKHDFIQAKHYKKDKKT